MGVAIARRTLLNDELERGTLIVPFGLAVPNHKRYVLLYAPGALNHPGVRAVHDLENTRRFIDRVRSLGAKVALDDFGAGYTSFSYLKDLPADLLKIDGSFIVNMNQHPANVAIVEAIVNLARNLGMKTIAEWAEDFATVQALADAGVDYVQGYAIARSMPPEKILAAQSSGAFVAESVMDPYLLTQKESSRGADTPSPSRFH